MGANGSSLSPDSARGHRDRSARQRSAKRPPRKPRSGRSQHREDPVRDLLRDDAKSSLSPSELCASGELKRSNSAETTREMLENQSLAIPPSQSSPMLRGTGAESPNVLHARGKGTRKPKQRSKGKRKGKGKRDGKRKAASKSTERRSPRHDKSDAADAPPTTAAEDTSRAAEEPLPSVAEAPAGADGSAVSVDSTVRSGRTSPPTDGNNSSRSAVDESHSTIRTRTTTTVSRQMEGSVAAGDEALFSRTGGKVGKADFEILACIGKGSFGKVYQVRHRESGRIFALKALRKESVISRKQVAHTIAENKILQKTQHPFIVKLHYAFQSDEKVYMVLDMVNGGELFFHLKRHGCFTEERVRFYAAELSLALIYLHSMGIVYRDLKPENILLDRSGHINLTDFGLSKELHPDESAVTFCGTPEYLAPEVLKAQGHDQSVDWWSLGTLMFEMLTGLPPFYSPNLHIMYQKILSGSPHFPSTLSAEARSLLTGLLERDPAKRLGSAASNKDQPDIRDHPFFASIDWSALERREIAAPFIPPVDDLLDLSQVDPSFVSIGREESLIADSALTHAEENVGIFEGFTFDGSSAMPVSSPRRMVTGSDVK